jgi:3-phytase
MLTTLVLSFALGGEFAVRATIETEPVPNEGDAADDPCIWVHPNDRARSVVIGTDKQGGLAVYDLGGKMLSYRADGSVNNVDVRYGFPLGAERVDLVVAGERRANRMLAYRVDPKTRELVPIAGELAFGIAVYGSCLHRSSNGRFYSFGCSEKGEIEQWELDGSSGRLEARLARRFALASKSEGMVADDELDRLYVAEEEAGIWRFDTAPESEAKAMLVDRVGERLAADVEGVALYHARGGGYLLASSQGDDRFVVYERTGANAYVTTFRVEAGEAIDGLEDTDGIDVVAAPLGPRFPEGLFVGQNGENGARNQSFLFVPWGEIARGAKPELAIGTAWDPRAGWTSK